MGGHSKILSSLTEGLLTITLADEVGRNVLGAALMAEFATAMEDAAANPAVRIVVVTNSGKTFCAGGDLKASPAALESDRFSKLLRRIQTFPKPVIGRIAGHAVGGGVGLAAACDISLAVEDATFGFSEVRLGVVPAIISVVCLAKMRRGDAMEVYLRGNRFSASRAAELGLITRALPAAKLDQELAAVVSDLRLGGPEALGLAKQLVNEVPAMTFDKAYSWTAALSASVFSGREARAGTDAFRERRSPPWAE
jgi:methylglutaconyl-CoA hydratase